MIAPDRRQQVARAFGLAALAYDGAAVVQRQIAGRLAIRIGALGLPPGISVLELGCGTGLLARALAGPLAPSLYVASDLAPAMLQACRHRLAPTPHALLAMDAERPAFAPGAFDLVCSSMAAQWFTDAPAALGALHGLLRPGGMAAIATLGPGSLPEWRACCLAEGVPPPLPAWPGAERLVAAWPGPRQVTVARLAVPLASGIDFLRGLHAIGAHVPRAGHRVLSPGTLRRVIRRLDGCRTATYEVVTAILRTGPEQPDP